MYCVGTHEDLIEGYYLHWKVRENAEVFPSFLDFPEFSFDSFCAQLPGTPQRRNLLKSDIAVVNQFPFFSFQPLIKEKVFPFPHKKN